MAMPNEYSLFCEGCTSYNIQYGDCIIIEGKAYCDGCVERKGLEIDFNKIKKTLRNMKEVSKK